MLLTNLVLTTFVVWVSEVIKFGFFTVLQPLLSYIIPIQSCSKTFRANVTLHNFDSCKLFSTQAMVFEKNVKYWWKALNFCKLVLCNKVASQIIQNMICCLFKGTSSIIYLFHISKYNNRFSRSHSINLLLELSALIDYSDWKLRTD